MTALETEVEWLRPLVNNQQWDYCVIWKLGDDPSRFIEWGGCCCSGGRRPQGIKIKDVKNNVIGECRDKLIKHPLTSVACNKLALLPSFFPLYSGIHGEVVISKQPRWRTTQNNASASDVEPNGTQVLIPVSWGLIELFTTKQVQKDQNIIDHISSHFRLSIKQESMSENVPTKFDLQDQLCDPQSSEDWLPSVNYLNFLPKIPQPKNTSSLEGSPTCSTLSNEQQLLEQKIKHKVEKGPFKSKNLVTERNRRKRIKDGILALRALVPKITKMDRISTLVDAADYIEELLATIEKYYDQIRAIEEDYEEDRPLLIREYADKDSESKRAPIVVEIEVIQIGMKDFLVRLICKQIRGGFSTLTEAIDSLGLQVTDANVTTLNGLVLNALTVEAKTGDVDANALKHSLMKLIS